MQLLAIENSLSRQSYLMIVGYLQVEYDFFGELRTHELKPGGSKIPVTAGKCLSMVS